MAWVSSSRHKQRLPAGLAQSADRPEIPASSAPTAARRDPKLAGPAQSAVKPGTPENSAPTAARQNRSKRNRRKEPLSFEGGSSVINESYSAIIKTSDDRL